MGWGILLPVNSTQHKMIYNAAETQPIRFKFSVYTFYTIPNNLQAFSCFHGDGCYGDHYRNVGFSFCGQFRIKKID